MCLGREGHLNEGEWYPSWEMPMINVIRGVQDTCHGLDSCPWETLTNVPKIKAFTTRPPTTSHATLLMWEEVDCSFRLVDKLWSARHWLDCPQCTDNQRTKREGPQASSEVYNFPIFRCSSHMLSSSNLSWSHYTSHLGQNHVYTVYVEPDPIFKQFKVTFTISKSLAVVKNQQILSSRNNNSEMKRLPRLGSSRRLSSSPCA